MFNYAISYRTPSTFAYCCAEGYESLQNRNRNTKCYKNKYTEWHRYYSNSGKPFYYSPLTHETQWEEPTHNVIIFDTNSPSFVSNECIIKPPSTTPSATAYGVPSLQTTHLHTHIYKNKKISKNINTYNHQNKPPKFGFTLQHFEEIIMKNVEKTMNNGTPLPQYKMDNGEIIIGFQYKSDLDIMEEGYWLNSFD